MWYPESVPGKEAFGLAAALLGATDRLVVASGIANIWARDAVAMENGARTLAEAYPDRFVLGIGVSHPETVRQRGHEFARPAALMREYLERMDQAAAEYQAASPERAAPRIVAAMGPLMLEVAASHADGAFPAPVSDSFTSHVRSVLGPDKLVVTGKYLSPGLSEEEARDAFSASLGFYRLFDIYRRHFSNMGWSEEAFEGDPPDEMIDQVVSAGEPEAIRDGIAAQFDAGADHVVAVLSGVDPEPDGLRLLGESIGLL